MVALGELDAMLLFDPPPIAPQREFRPMSLAAPPAMAA
jgi:hypothetical protein